MFQFRDGAMMRLGTILVLILAGQTWAQSSRDSYRVPYQAWRQAAPALEQDASAPGPAFAGQAQTAAQAGQAFFNAREVYFTTAQPGRAEQIKWTGTPLEHGDTALSTPPEIQQLLAVAAAKVATNIGRLADDKDPAIRQVRQAMERERAALRSLTETLSLRSASVDELAGLTNTAESQRAAVSQAQSAGGARRAQLAAHIQGEAKGWTEYYKNLAESATSGRISGTGGAAGTSAPGTSAIGVGGPNPAAPAKAAPASTTGLLAMSRYTGEWMFASKGLFYGPQPEMVGLVVQESNGRVIGTLDARFAAAGNAVDPTLKLEFQGAVQQSRNQTFPLRTSDGTVGSIELLPGSAFNLLEVTIRTDPQAGKITSANFVLVKR
jgi:hypothetical protein